MEAMKNTAAAAAAALLTTSDNEDDAGEEEEKEEGGLGIWRGGKIKVLLLWHLIHKRVAVMQRCDWKVLAAAWLFSMAYV